MVKKLAMIFLLALSVPAWASPLTIVVGFTPGSQSDTIARAIQKNLQDNYNIASTVEYKTGAGGDIAVAYVAGKKDPGTYIVLTGNNLAYHNIKPNPNYDLTNDLVPVAYLGHSPMLLVANAGLGIKNISDLKSLTDVRYGSSGIGSTSHIQGALLSRALKKSMTHVPYRGASAIIPDVISGRIEITYNFAATVGPHVQSGNLVALAVTNERRLDDMPNVPTLNELGLKDYWIKNWYVLMANPGADRNLLAKVQQSIQELANDPVRNKAFAKTVNVYLEAGTVGSAKQHLDREIKRYRVLDRELQLQ